MAKKLSHNYISKTNCVSQVILLTLRFISSRNYKQLRQIRSQVLSCESLAVWRQIDQTNDMFSSPALMIFDNGTKVVFSSPLVNTLPLLIL